MKTGFSSLKTVDLRGTGDTDGEGFAPPATGGDQGGPGPSGRGKEANTGRSKGRFMSKAEVKDPEGDATYACDDTKGW